MGKKSLFQPTSGPSKKAAPKTSEDKDVKDVKENFVAEGEATASPAPADRPAAQTDLTAATEKTKPSPKQVPPSPSDSGMNTPPRDPLAGETFQQPPQGTYLKTAVAVIGGLLLLLCLASFLNSGKFYVRNTKGAVEIWQGTFSPAGKTRLMVLHGANWDEPVRDSYSQKTVYDFAARFYIDKAVSLTDATVPADYESIQYYLDQARELMVETNDKNGVATIRQVQSYLTEAAILDASGEKEAMALAEKRLDTVKHALSGLLLEKKD